MSVKTLMTISTLLRYPFYIDITHTWTIKTNTFCRLTQSQPNWTAKVRKKAKTILPESKHVMCDIINPWRSYRMSLWWVESDVKRKGWSCSPGCLSQQGITQSRRYFRSRFMRCIVPAMWGVTWRNPTLNAPFVIVSSRLYRTIWH